MMAELRLHLPKPVTFISCGFFNADEGWIHGERELESYELILVLDKTLHLEVDGIKYELMPGDLLVIPAGVQHRGYREEEADTRFFWAHFGLEAEHLAEGEEAQMIVLPRHMEELNMARMVNYCNQLCHINEDQAYVDPATHYMMSALLNEVATQYRGSQSEKDYYGSAAKIMEWVRVNHASDIKIADVAEHFSYSPTYMSTYFRKHVGQSLLSYLSDVRIEKACQLLQDTTLTVMEISAKVGFRDSKYFFRVFKQKMNQTPSEYRNGFNQTHYNKK